ncbi:hypothetical protein GCM10023259_079300 [Thermocatellispora tengchongensis]
MPYAPEERLSARWFQLLSRFHSLLRQANWAADQPCLPIIERAIDLFLALALLALVPLVPLDVVLDLVVLDAVLPAVVVPVAVPKAAVGAAVVASAGATAWVAAPPARAAAIRVAPVRRIVGMKVSLSLRGRRLPTHCRIHPGIGSFESSA